MAEIATNGKPSTRNVRPNRAGEPSTNYAFRLTVDQLEQLRRRAKEQGMTVTAFILAATLGTLGEKPSHIAAKLDDHEERLRRLEQFGDFG